MKNMFLNCTVVLIPVIALLLKSALLDMQVRKFPEDKAKEKAL